MNVATHPRVMSLCAGVGLLDLGLRLALPESRTVLYVEREVPAAAILAARMRDGHLHEAPIWSDLTTLDARAWRGKVDLVVGGFPCQPFSGASRGRRTAVDLWPEFARVIRDVQPRAVFVENVDEAPIVQASRDLEGMGYRTDYDPFCPAELGAPIARTRWWLLAYSNGNSQSALPVDVEVAGLRPITGTLDWDHYPAEVLGVCDGSPAGLDISCSARVAALGNAVVPIVAAVAFRTLAMRLRQGMNHAPE